MTRSARAELGRSRATRAIVGKMLERVGLITRAELEHWFARVHKDAGGDDENPLSTATTD